VDLVSREHRLQRLRHLLDRIEKLPASAERERMLREVRARVVDVDTGVTPRAMLTVDPDPLLATDPGPPAARAPKAVARMPADPDGGRPAVLLPEPAKAIRAAPPPEAVSRAGAPAGFSLTGAGDWLSLAGIDEVLSLDDSAPPLTAGEARAGHDPRPWTRGLRG
jgi:hypothetical protein